MKHQIIEVEITTRLSIRLPSDDVLPEVGLYSRESMLRREVSRWVERARSSFAGVNPERSDPGVVRAAFEVLR
jgi:hypothetical protein